MKAQYKTENGRLTFGLEGDQLEVFGDIARIQEVFEADTECGCCGKTRIRFRVRTLDDGTPFYEFVCLDCHAVLSFGKHKIGKTLFPKRKEGERWLDNRGWKVWQPGAAAPAERDGRTARASAK